MFVAMVKQTSTLLWHAAPGRRFTTMCSSTGWISGFARLLLIATAACGNAPPVSRVVVPRLPGETSAPLNAVFFLSSCTPCNSVVIGELAEWTRSDDDRQALTIIVNPLAPSAAQAYKSLFAGSSRVRFVVDRGSKLALQSEIPAYPFLIVFDRQRRLLRAEAISPVGAVYSQLNDELTALHTVQTR